MITWPVGTSRQADLQFSIWSSKNISAPKFLRKLVLSIPPKKRDSSTLIFHSLRVLITLSWEGLDLAVTSAILIGHSFLGKLC